MQKMSTNWLGGSSLAISALLCLLLTTTISVSAGTLRAQQTIPAGTLVESVRTLHGQIAITQFVMQAGIGTSMFRNNGSASPFDHTSTNVTLTIDHKRLTSTNQAVSDALHGEDGPLLWSNGDTMTFSYNQGCTHYVDTYTWEGGSGGWWVLTGESRTQINSPQCNKSGN